MVSCCCRCCPSLVDALSFVFVFGMVIALGKLTLWTPWMLDAHMPHASSNARFNVTLPTRLHERLALTTDYIYVPSWYAAKSFHLGVVLHVKKPCERAKYNYAIPGYYLRTCGCEVQLKCVDAYDEPLAYIRLGELKKEEEFYFSTHPTLRPNPSHKDVDATRPRCSLELYVTRKCNITADELGPMFVYWHADAVPEWSASDWIPRTLYNIFYPSS